ncbi:MAG: acetate/propionate family kinase [Candidatus Sulfobium sp.]|jgi:acetate kinase
MSLRILTVNSGSSSLKLALYSMGASEEMLLLGRMERIGLRDGSFRMSDGSGNILVDERSDFPDHDSALKMFFDWLGAREEGKGLDAVGHRIVHGGADYVEPHRVGPDLMSSLRDLVPLAPDHLPHEIKAIDAVGRFSPHLKQVACFDTAFHRTMPGMAQLYPLPRRILNRGVIRYGFHGLSYEYIMGELRQAAGEEAAHSRTIIAHLGNGASMAAVKGGTGLDTTMGFTPAGGLMMSSRSGDLDPGVILYLLKELGYDSSTLNDLINKQAGLSGLSGSSSDMKDLLERENDDHDAAEAVGLFCYQARKFLGALSAVLGGLDTLVFTAGIGENSPQVRWRICENMGYLGIDLDEERNDSHATVISKDDAPVTVRVMKTNEGLMIARHTRDVIRTKK